MEQYLNVVKVGNNICVRGIDENNNRYIEKIPYEPYSYIESQEDTGYYSMFGKPLQRIDHASMSEQWEFKKRCQSTEIDVYGMDDPVCQFMTDTYNHEYDINNVRVFYIDMENEMVDSNGDRFGIDPIGAHGKMTAMTLYDTKTKTYYVWGTKVWVNNDYKHIEVKYHHCIDEHELLTLFLRFWTENYPDIVSGWSSNRYDIPYTFNRISKVLGESKAKTLSPFNKITKREFNAGFGRIATEYNIAGISSVDYIEVYKKNKFHKQESYKLDFIAMLELGKGKVDFHDDGYRDLDDLYERNPQMYIDYNIRDVESLVQIDDKNKFMDIVIGIAHYAIVNYDEVYSVLRCWDAIRHTYLKEKNIISSPKSRNAKTEKFTGAYVKEPIADLYKWVMTFDLKALYPSIIQTCNIGDETLVPPTELPSELHDLYDRDISQEILKETIRPEQIKALVDNNMTMAANGTFYYNKEHSVQSILSADILIKRRVFKDTMLKYKDEYERAKTAGKDAEELKRLNDLITYNKNQQLVVKVLANSLYGAMGNEYDRYFDIKLAEGVTLTGQTIIKWSEKKVNEYINKVLNTKDVAYCIYSDTDSIFVNMEPFVEKMGLEDSEKTVDFLDKVGNTLNEKLTEFYDELGTILNTKNNQMDMKREVISSNSIFRSKKNYAMKVWDNEGVRYDEPDYKIMGIEVVRSTTPKFIKERLKKALVMILNDCSRTELIDYVDQVKTEYKSNKNIEDIAFPKGTNDIEKWMDETTIYKSGTPIHVRGAILFNKYYADEDTVINSGDNVRYIYLRLPNPIRENVISFTTAMPDDLYQYIDWEINFEKIFSNPVKSLATVAGWSMENTVSLMDLLEAG